MINIDDKEYRNLQEQVGYLTEELKKLKQSLGSALPEPIEGPQGPQGETGATGPQGRTPKIGFGFGPLPTDSSFENGDIYIIRGNNPQYNLTKGNLYKKINNQWQLQLNLVGPQGPVGVTDNEVVANPEGEVQDSLDKIQIDGVIYSIYQSLFGKFVKIMEAPAGTTLTDEQKENIVNGVFINGIFLDYKNPIFFPATKSGNYYYGIYAGPYNETAYTILGQYQINPDNSIVDRGVYGNIELRCISAFNGKIVPNFPSSPTNSKILVYKTENELEWQDKPVLYRHNIKLTFDDFTELYFTVINTTSEEYSTFNSSEFYQVTNSIGGYKNSDEDYFTVTIKSIYEGDITLDYQGTDIVKDYLDHLTSIVDTVYKAL